MPNDSGRPWKPRKNPITSLAQDMERKTAVHFILAEMCGNRFFEALIRSFVELTLRVVQRAAEPDFPYIHPAGMHRSIVEAVLSGNSKKAALVMKKHATEFGEILMKMEKLSEKRKPFEGFVAAEILKQQIVSGCPRALNYFRELQGLEVDFIVPAGNRRLLFMRLRSPGLSSRL